MLKSFRPRGFRSFLSTPVINWWRPKSFVAHLSGLLGKDHVWHRSRSEENFSFMPSLRFEFYYDHSLTMSFETQMLDWNLNSFSQVVENFPFFSFDNICYWSFKSLFSRTHKTRICKKSHFKDLELSLINEGLDAWMSVCGVCAEVNAFSDTTFPG